MSIESETWITNPIIETTICVICNTRKCDHSRNLLLCGPICEYCFNKIGNFQLKIESKRRLLKNVPSDIAKKIERNIRKLERKIIKMTTISD